MSNSFTTPPSSPIKNNQELFRGGRYNDHHQLRPQLYLQHPPSQRNHGPPSTVLRLAVNSPATLPRPVEQRPYRPLEPRCLFPAEENIPSSAIQDDRPDMDNLLVLSALVPDYNASTSDASTLMPE